VRDTGRSKHFGRGLLQLDEEGVVQVLRDPDGLDPTILVAAVGPLQFEVFRHRMEEEFGAPVEMMATPHVLARRTDKESMPELRRQHGVKVLTRADGTLLVLFESPYNLTRLERDKPELTLDGIIVTS